MEGHTGLFVSWEKGNLLINTIQEILLKKYHTVAITGSRLSNNTCEIILSTKQSSKYADISGAKHLIESYLKMIDESKLNGYTPKKTEVIELDVDEDITCIILDDSVNETGSVATGEKQSSIITNSVSQNITIDSHDRDKGSSVSQMINQSNSRRGLKRKYPYEEEEDVVEIVDDDVIVLDDSFPDLNISNKISNNFPGDNLIDLTKINYPPFDSAQSKKPSQISEKCLNLDDCQQRTVSELSPPNQIPSMKSKLKSLVSHTKTTADKVSKFLTTVSTSNTSTSNPTLTKTNKASECVTAFTSTTPTVSTTNPSRESKFDSNPKKVSKLAYNRPAHLLVPLTQSSSNTNVDSQSNIYNPNAGLSEKKTGLRPIVIDGNNVGIGHGKGQFSLKGIEICINYFEKRGHRQIKAFLPHYRTNRDTFEGLRTLERQGTVVITPSRKVDGKVVASYDDRYIVQYASEVGGVIVSSDNFRDLMQENPSWKETIERRLLMFTWVDDFLMFPQDPLGRNGPSLDEFLSFPNS